MEDSGWSKYKTILEERVPGYDFKPLTPSEKKSYFDQSMCFLFSEGPSEVEYRIAMKRVLLDCRGDESLVEQAVYRELLCMYAELRNWLKFLNIHKTFDIPVEDVDPEPIGGAIGHEMYYFELEKVYIPLYLADGSFSHYEVECDDKLIGKCFELGGVITPIEDTSESPREEFRPTEDCVDLGFIRVADVLPDIIDRRMKGRVYPEPVEDTVLPDLVDELGSSVVDTQVLSDEQTNISEECTEIENLPQVQEDRHPYRVKFDLIIFVALYCYLMVIECTLMMTRLMCFVLSKWACDSRDRIAKGKRRLSLKSPLMVECFEAVLTNCYYVVKSRMVEHKINEMDISIVLKFFPP